MLPQNLKWKFPFSLVSPCMGSFKNSTDLIIRVSFHSVWFPLVWGENFGSWNMQCHYSFHSVWFPLVWGVMETLILALVENGKSFHSVWFPLVWGGFFPESHVQEVTEVSIQSGFPLYGESSLREPCPERIPSCKSTQLFFILNKV
jgi:hypothetical protein